MSDRLLTLGAAQHDVLSTRDATRLDVDPNSLAELVDAGTLVRVRRGAYVLGSTWAQATPERRLDLRARAVLHARGRPHEAATHQSALAVHGLPLHDAPLDVVDLCGHVSRVRTASGLRLHPTDVELPVVVVDGCRSVSVDVALAQVALREGREAVVVAADRALREGATDLERVTSLVARLAESPRRAARAVTWLRQADPLSESVGETRTRLLLLDLGHPVTSQARVADEQGRVFARVDLMVAGRVVVEFDGLVKYEGAEGRAALAAEKAREDRLRALGYEVVRITWVDLEHPGRVAALVRAALARAAARESRPTAS
ncbi:type IV toxin-antitoxin system AbiEi family antitoxin domain-containing protein [Phycicoccus avicenniae]|uniref:type IV toxin-antitoxin system AbiEi family antitoxin domain-containing protein n=1 Tax=Phycicoccus avicenniae TaxID=2828860 RepID=UPI003D2DEC09